MEGYVPVGSCATGSGDPYFIKIHDTPPGPLYRIYHDACSETKCPNDAVVVVLTSYTVLLAHKDA